MNSSQSFRARSATPARTRSIDGSGGRRSTVAPFAAATAAVSSLDSRSTTRISSQKRIDGRQSRSSEASFLLATIAVIGSIPVCSQGSMDSTRQRSHATRAARRLARPLKRASLEAYRRGCRLTYGHSLRFVPSRQELPYLFNSARPYRRRR